MTAKKFYITEEDKQRAEKLTKRIEQLQGEMRDVIEESFTSGAHVSLGFPTWRAYADAVLDQSCYRTDALAARFNGGSAVRKNTGIQSERSQQVLRFVRNNPGCTMRDIREALHLGRGGFEQEIITRLRGAGLIKYEGKKGHAVMIWSIEEQAA